MTGGENQVVMCLEVHKIERGMWATKGHRIKRLISVNPLVFNFDIVCAVSMPVTIAAPNLF